MTENEQTIYTGGLIFDGHQLLEKHNVVVANGLVTSVLPDSAREGAQTCIDLNGDILSVGYADLQVNGGGGKLFNDAPSVESLTTIAHAHRKLGTTCFLPTLITDTPHVTEAAIDAVSAAMRTNVSSVAGLHLEGPHLSVLKKGAHLASYIRPMQQSDLNVLLKFSDDIALLKVTVAPENVTCNQVSALAEAGVIVALGHTNASYATCMEYHAAGARCVTHLYNAMSQLGSREPGLVGAALDAPELAVGLIADGVHVHEAAIRIAWNTKANEQQLYLVTDAMALAGTTLNSFTLNDRTISRQNGRLTLEDGTLAGADVDLTTSIRFLRNNVGVDLVDALRASVAVPRRILGLNKDTSELIGQSVSDVIRISAELDTVSNLQ